MTERLFFALWPSDDLRQQLDQLTQEIAQMICGKVVDANNLHITLAFLGNVSGFTKNCMLQVADGLQEKSFQLNLNELGYWIKPRILYLGTQKVPNELLTLVKNLTTALTACGYQPEKPTYQLHATLMRKVLPIKELPMIKPLIWTANHFYLVRSEMHQAGVHYEVVNQWYLG